MPKIVVAHGDGIGPEITAAVLNVLKASGAGLQIDEVVIGRKAYEAGHTNGIPPEVWALIEQSDAIVKGPIETPRGGGYKSVNVSIRKALGLFANVRPTVAVHGLPTSFPGMNVVIVRENEEDLYAGIEHRHTADSYQSLKAVSATGTERICRYAFEYARSNGRRKVTCVVKDNIMKGTDGLFREVFERVAAEYPDILADSQIVDIGTARLAARPLDYDVVVTTNLYGDIISDVVAEVAGSVGIGASSNVGRSHAMFEAIHGSAPDIAGKGIANPSGLLLAAVMMLNHLGLNREAGLIHNAWLRTIEDGIGTGDLRPLVRVDTQGFAEAVIGNLGKLPSKPVAYTGAGRITLPEIKAPRVEKRWVGSDVFVEWHGTPAMLADRVKTGLSYTRTRDEAIYELESIASKGMVVWPGEPKGANLTDHYQLRIKVRECVPVSHMTLPFLMQQLIAGVTMTDDLENALTRIENLYEFDGKPGFSKGQGA